MPKTVVEKSFFTLVLLGYLAAGALFSIYTPPWQAPDEPAHYNYIRQVAENGCCPRIEAGDWQSVYLSQLTTAKFAQQHLDRLDTIQYEDHHPPLYYLLASVVYKLSNGNLTALRFLSVVLGAGVVGLSYLIIRRISPGHPQIALGTMALVAFLPQHLSMMSAVNNDALAELLVALALLWLARYLTADDISIWQLGLITGLALLTKITIYFLALLVPLAIWLKWRRENRPLRALTRSIVVFALVAGVIGGIWWLRNISVYGFPDFLGLGAHDTVVADQPRSADFVAQHGMSTYLRQMLSTTFNSFWGQFGWMALPLGGVFGGWINRAFALFSLAGLSGFMLIIRSQRASREVASQSRLIATPALIIFVTATLLVSLQFLYYNIEFQQWQGRYLFPALIPIAFMLVYGVDYWREKLLSRWEAARWLVVLTIIGLLALDIYLLIRVIVPGLSP